MTNKMGRPPLYTPELGELICTLLLEGKGLRKIQVVKGMPSMGCILRWVSLGEQGDEKYKDFYELYKHVMANRAHVFFEEAMDIADDQSIDIKTDSNGCPVFDDAGNPVIDANAIQRSRLRVETRKWAAMKLLPRKYGERQAVEHSGPDGGDIPISVNINFVKPDDG